MLNGFKAERKNSGEECSHQIVVQWIGNLRRDGLENILSHTGFVGRRQLTAEGRGYPFSWSNRECSFAKLEDHLAR